MEDIKFHQDNMSAMLTENNRKESSTKWTKHTRSQYFFIKYHIDNGDLSLKYLPMGEMYSYFFTKPLKGSIFWRFRDMIQVILDSTPDVETICPRYIDKVTSQDNVGQNDR